VDDIFKVTGSKVKVIQQRPYELDSSRSTERMSTKTYMNISCSRATNGLDFEGPGFKVQAHRNVIWQRHTDRPFAIEDRRPIDRQLLSAIRGLL